MAFPDIGDQGGGACRRRGVCEGEGDPGSGMRLIADDSVYHKDLYLYNSPCITINHVHSCIAELEASEFSFAAASRRAFIRASAFKIPFHASRSTLSSCSPRFFWSELPSEGRPTPSEGGTKPGGGALIAEGAILECRMCANDDRIAP
jgi:hypothetical protein